MAPSSSLGASPPAIFSLGQLAGHSALFNEPLIAALHVVETIISAPQSLANLLEAAGSLALERAGAILDHRFSAE